MKIIRLLSIAIFLGAALGTTSCVMSGLDGVEYHAVVYGLNEYDSIINLSFAENDGKDMNDLLTDQGVNVINTRTGYSGQSITKADFLADIENAKGQISSNDIFIFYFAGHGQISEDGIGSGIAFSDSALKPPEDLYFIESTAVMFDELFSIIDSLNALHNIIILDACNSGGFLNSSFGINRLPEDAQYPANINPDDNTSFFDTISNYFAEYNYDNYTVIASGGQKEPVPDTWLFPTLPLRPIPFDPSWNLPDTADFRDNGVFTSIFMLAAARGDLNSDGYVTTTEAYHYTFTTYNKTYNQAIQGSVRFFL
jgi:hypothetical protein